MKWTSMFQNVVAASPRGAVRFLWSGKARAAVPRRRQPANPPTPALLAWLSVSLAVAAQFPSPVIASAPAVTVREVQYDATLGEHEARCTMSLDVECAAKTGGSLVWIEGDVALLPSKLPDPLSILREGNRFTLAMAHGGRYRCKLDFVAKMQRAEPWNQVSFTGPAAAIASVTAQASSAGMEVQLQSGTVVETGVIKSGRG